MAYYLGIDAGTSGVKAIVMDSSGIIHGTGYKECDLITPQPGWIEQDPLDWWDACDLAVRQAVQNSGKGKEIAGIGFSGQMQGCTPFDKNMQAIGNSIIWMDQRSVKEVLEINDLIDIKESLGITGNYCLNSFWAPKILWIRNNQPALYEKIHKLLFAKDYLRFRMTGEIATDVTDASMCFLQDITTRQWSGRMFEALDIPQEIVPEKVLESPEVAGSLREAVANDWGLRPGIPVAAGGGDQPTGAVGTGISESGIVGSSIGTSGVVFGCIDSPLFDTENRAVYSLPHSVPGKWAFIGLVLTAGGSFKWLRDTVFADKKAELERSGTDPYDFMTGLAARACPGSEGLLFLPYLNGEKTRINSADARGLFFGLSQRHGLPEICRSVMEGITFAMRDTIEICRGMGNEVHEIRASGGGSKSELWRQLQADIYKADVISMNIEEGPAAGAAIFASVGAGEYSSAPEACEALLKVSHVTEPIKENVKIYEDYYRTYRELFPALETLFEKQARNVEKYLG